ncbi:endonuclease III [Danxiaibacter flavus]|uniref:Endonuclease III n=1 Tax=Danxiaibacter flavus TaxID=3049108 RepID=A0ABV3ZMA6_9BACT|nr:endonuclease III [Chitinophagaceae bacterium DXS]
MKQQNIDWAAAVKPLIKKYKDTPHPLEAKNLYEMMVMVVLSARSNDKLINSVAPDLFKEFPTMARLSQATPAAIIPHITKVINHGNKAEWLSKIAKAVKTDKAIPLTMEELVKLPGIGRKSANVIKRYAGVEAEGIMVDLHTVRVSNRLGIANSEDPVVIEKQMMEVLPKNEWDAGMAMSFLGRDICRPKPECPVCLMKKDCKFYQENFNN